MGAKILTFGNSSIRTSGTSFENEPIIKSDGASSDVMEWAASTGSSNIKITEDSGNKLDLAVTGGLRVGTSTDALEDGELMVDSIEVRSDDNGAGVRIIGGKTLELLNVANDTNVDIINSGGSGVAQLGLIVAGDEKVTIASDGKITTKSDGNAIKLDGTANTTRGIFIRNTGGSAHGYLHTDGNLKIIAEDSGKSISFYTADDGTGTARMAISSTGLATFANGIAFGSQTNTSATGAAVSVNGTILNHYEEGTWTPVPKDNQATVVATSTALGRYIRVGKIVTCTYRLVRNDTQSLTNTLYLYGLPFPSQNNVQTKNIGGGTSWFPNDTYAGFNYALQNTDQWIIRKNDATGYATTNVWSNGQELVGTIIYEADA